MNSDPHNSADISLYLDKATSQLWKIYQNQRSTKPGNLPESERKALNTMADKLFAAAAVVVPPFSDTNAGYMNTASLLITQNLRDLIPGISQAERAAIDARLETTTKPGQSASMKSSVFDLYVGLRGKWVDRTQTGIVGLHADEKRRITVRDLSLDLTVDEIHSDFAARRSLATWMLGTYIHEIVHDLTPDEFGVEDLIEIDCARGFKESLTSYATRQIMTESKLFTEIPYDGYQTGTRQIEGLLALLSPPKGKPTTKAEESKRQEILKMFLVDHASMKQILSTLCKSVGADYDKELKKFLNYKEPYDQADQ